MERKNQIFGCGLSALLAGMLLVGLSAGEAAAKHDQARVKTRVVKTHVVKKPHKVAGYNGSHRGHAYAYGRNPNWRPAPTSADFDRDGIPNYRDRDDDNDGILDSRDRDDRTLRRARKTGSWVNDLDRDGIVDRRDRDVDNDGVRNQNDRYPRDRRRR